MGFYVKIQREPEQAKRPHHPALGHDLRNEEPRNRHNKGRACGIKRQQVESEQADH
jgi:hypothetical protein